MKSDFPSCRNTRVIVATHGWIDGASSRTEPSTVFVFEVTPCSARWSKRLQYRLTPCAGGTPSPCRIRIAVEGLRQQVRMSGSITAIARKTRCEGSAMIPHHSTRDWGSRDRGGVMIIKPSKARHQRRVFRAPLRPNLMFRGPIEARNLWPLQTWWP